MRTSSDYSTTVCVQAISSSESYQYFINIFDLVSLAHSFSIGKCILFSLQCVVRSSTA